MKEYQIKELSNLLGISKEMLRYYEKYGAVTPSRNKANNYRVYSVMDYFAFAEAISLSQFNVNIKEIYELKSNDYAYQIRNMYDKYIQETSQTLEVQKILMRRAEELRDRMMLGELNRSNIWVKREKGYKLYPLVTSKNDDYGDIILPEKMRHWTGTPEHLALCDGFLLFEENEERWLVGCNDDNAKAMSLPETEELICLEPSYCLCMIADMGDIGSFDADQIRSIFDTMKEQPYTFEGTCRAKLLGRGHGKDGFIRLIELQIPLKP